MGSRAALYAGRSGNLLRRCDRDLLDAAHGVQASTAPGRRADTVSGRAAELQSCEMAVPDHTTVSRRAMSLPSIAEVHVPDGPLHVLIDSTGLKVYGAGE